MWRIVQIWSKYAADRPDRAADRLDSPDRAADRPDRPDRAADRLDRADRTADRLDRADRAAGRPDARCNNYPQRDMPTPPADAPFSLHSAGLVFES